MYIDILFYLPDNPKKTIYSFSSPLGCHVPRIGEIVTVPSQIPLSSYKVNNVITAFGEGRQIITIALDIYT